MTYRLATVHALQTTTDKRQIVPHTPTA